MKKANQKCACGTEMVKLKIEIIVCPGCKSYHMPKWINVDKLLREGTNHG